MASSIPETGEFETTIPEIYVPPAKSLGDSGLWPLDWAGLFRWEYEIEGEVDGEEK